MYEMTDGLLTDEIRAARDTVIRFMGEAVVPVMDGHEQRKKQR